MAHVLKILLPALLLWSCLAPAARAEGAEGGEEFDPVHHIADGYYLDFEPIGKVELPRLFLVRGADGRLGFDAFASTRRALTSGAYRLAPHAEEGAHGAEDEGGGPSGEAAHADTPAEPHDVTSEDVAAGTPAAHTEELVEGSMHLESALVRADGGDILIDFSITRHLAFAILCSVLVAAVFITLARRYRRGVGRTSAPAGRFHNLFELLVVFVRDEIARPNLGHQYKKFLPYLLTAFFFILTCNMIGLVPFGATATSNLMVTGVLAVFTFAVIQLNGSKHYWKHIFWPPGVPVLIKPILIPIEFLGIFTKPFALAIRLFANMTAGHLVILSLIGLIFSFAQLFGPGVGYSVSPVSIAFSLFIYLLELLVAFIQAYIFTMLSALFIGMAIEDQHHEAPEEGHLPALPAEDHSGATPHPILGPDAGKAGARVPQPVPVG